MTSGGGGAGTAGIAAGGGGSAGSPATTPSAGSGGAPSGGGGNGGGGAASGGGGAAGTAGGGAGGGGTGGAGGAGSDTCPEDPDKTAPGECGCGVPDVDGINGAGCGPLKNSITHRYSFEGNATDSVGSAHGTLMGGATIASGALTLAGGTSGQYLDLPSGIISSLSDATFEAFVTWSGSAGGDWQRIFDFGSSDVDGNGSKYIFLSARTFRTAYTSATPPKEVIANSNTPFPTTTAQVAVVVNATDKKLEIYLEGNQVATTTLDQPLSAIDDTNNWLGRSQFKNDEYFAGKISEFRIYEAALTGPQLKTSKKMGESTTYLKK